MAMFVLLVILIILFMYKIISSQSLSVEGHWAVCMSYQLPVEQEEGSRAMVTKKFVLLKCGYPLYKVGISPPFTYVLYATMAMIEVTEFVKTVSKHLPQISTLCLDSHTTTVVASTTSNKK